MPYQTTEENEKTENTIEDIQDSISRLETLFLQNASRRTDSSNEIAELKSQLVEMECILVNSLPYQERHKVMLDQANKRLDGALKGGDVHGVHRLTKVASRLERQVDTDEKARNKSRNIKRAIAVASAYTALFALPLAFIRPKRTLKQKLAAAIKDILSD